MFFADAKPWTAVAVLKLVEKGAFGLDDPIPPLIDPWLRKYNGTTLTGLGWTSEIGKVTVRMLLHMNRQAEPRFSLLRCQGNGPFDGGRGPFGSIPHSPASPKCQMLPFACLCPTRLPVGEVL